MLVPIPHPGATLEPNPPCPMPHAPCPMPHAPCPMPHAQFPITKVLRADGE
ncbi:MAG: hypothetical protein WBL95_14670 [Microcoleus sp.]